MTIPACQCAAAGSCPLFKREQSVRDHQICRHEVLTPEKCDFYRGKWYAKAHPDEFAVPAGLSPAEYAELLADKDPTLIGNRIAESTKLFGIPPCGGCDARRRWLNKAHQWLAGEDKKPPAGPVFVTTRQLIDDVYGLAKQLPSNIAGLVGVARSGVLPATLLAMHRHLPLWILRETQEDIVDAGHGWRLRQHTKCAGPLLVVDDTVMTGASLRHVQKVISKYPEQTFQQAVIYKNPAAGVKVDYWGKDLPSPHFLEWNLFNSVHLDATAFDFDGVLCTDGAPMPNYLPRKGAIPLIVTGRPERDRARSFAWLSHWGIKVQRLIMWPGSIADRDKPGAISAYKAQHFVESGLAYFVESCPIQAREIAAIAHKPVICPAAGKVF
jgi:hypoxanthine phosphoribosyltransferase